MNPLVVYGCGYSLSGLSDEQWDELRQYDSIGVNWFVFQRWIEPTYMLVGDIRPDKRVAKMGRSFDEAYERYVEEARAPCYRQTAFLSTKEQLPTLAELNTELYEWEPAWAQSSVTVASRYGVLKGHDSLLWAGVDLYDYRFFFLGKDGLRSYGLRGGGWAKRKLHGRHQAYKKLKTWFDSGVCEVPVYSYNPKSLILEMGAKLW